MVGFSGNLYRRSNLRILWWNAWNSYGEHSSDDRLYDPRLNYLLYRLQ